MQTRNRSDRACKAGGAFLMALGLASFHPGFLMAQAIGTGTCPASIPFIGPAPGSIVEDPAPVFVPSNPVLEPAAELPLFFFEPNVATYVPPLTAPLSAPRAAAPATSQAAPQRVQRNFYSGQSTAPKQAAVWKAAEAEHGGRRNDLAPGGTAERTDHAASAANPAENPKARAAARPLAGKGRQFGVIEGEVISGTGRPEEGVSVVIRSKGPNAMEKTTTTDTLGRFAVSVGHGAWEIYVEDQDGQRRLAKTINVDKNQIHHLPIYR